MALSSNYVKAEAKSKKFFDAKPLDFTYKGDQTGATVKGRLVVDSSKGNRYELTTMAGSSSPAPQLFAKQELVELQSIIGELISYL